MKTAFYRLAALACAIMLASVPVLAQTPDEEAARKHIIRGAAAIEAARSADELADAAAEFKKATEVAPTMAAAWYNLGMTQGKIGQYGEAIDSYKKYLVLAPEAQDAQKVKDEIIKLEYLMEKSEAIKSRAGAWVREDGALFQAKVDGNRITLSSNSYRPHNTELEERDAFNPGFPSNRPTTMKYVLDLHGSRITGAWARAATKADVCAFPEDGGELTGEMKDQDHTLTLRYTFTRYSHSKAISLFGDDSCREGEATKVETEKRFFGPLPEGEVVNFDVGGISSYCKGWGCKDGYSGRLYATQIKKDSPEYAAGLRQWDDIVAIDGAAVKTLSTAADVVMKLRGKPDTEVVLTVLHGGAPTDIRVRRVPSKEGE